MNHEVPEIKIELKTDAQFRVKVLKGSGVKSDTGWFKNLILNTGLNRLGQAGPNDNTASICRVGSGNTTPSNTDSGLVSQLGSASAEQRTSQTYGINIDGGYYWYRVTWTFTEGAVVGNVAELGVGWHASNTNTLFSRALIKDSMGNPTTITVLPDEVLQVTWERRTYWPTTDNSGTFTNTGNIGGDFDWVARASSIGSWGHLTVASDNGGFRPRTSASSGVTETRIYYGGTLGDITTTPTGTVNTAFTISDLGYVNDSYTTRARFSFALGQGNNASGIGSAVAAFGADYQRVMIKVGFTPALPKTSSRLLTFDISMTWARMA